MQVMLTCECGQGLRTEVGQAVVCVQCPSCGRTINVFPPAGASEAPVQQKASGNALVSMVLGLVSLAPIVGIITAIPAIVLGSIVLLRKRPGRGFAITGLCTALGSLLTIQAGSVLYAILIYTTITNTISMVSATSGTMVSQPVTLSVPEESATPRLAAGEVADALQLGFEIHEDANAASASLIEARRLYELRELPGNRFKCLREYSLHLARRGRADFADPSDRGRHNRVYKELFDLVLAKYERAGQLKDDGDWEGAGDVYLSIATEVPAPENAIHINALAGVQECRVAKIVDMPPDSQWRPTTTAPVIRMPEP